MKILFNKKFIDFHHRKYYEEASYRLQAFADNYKDTHADGFQYLSIIHPEEYLVSFRDSCEKGDKIAEVILSPETYEAALLAVGLSVKASENGDFAVVRPPGHHAMRSEAAGFCFFNNIAIAAQKLANEGKKVFILDIDGHHGDGTQAIFYDNPDVFFCSIHQQWAYPGTGFPTETGIGNGLGTTLNIPIMAGSKDVDFYGAINKAIAAAKDFEADVLAVSAGFDGYEGDNLLELNITLKGYYECGLRLRRAFPNMFAVLEGGYHDDVLQCVEAFVEGVNVGSRPRKNLYNSEMSIG